MDMNARVQWVGLKGKSGFVLNFRPNLSTQALELQIFFLVELFLEEKWLIVGFENVTGIHVWLLLNFFFLYWFSEWLRDTLSSQTQVWVIAKPRRMSNLLLKFKEYFPLK